MRRKTRKLNKPQNYPREIWKWIVLMNLKNINMKKDYLSTLIAIGFFAGTFVIAFSTNDSDVAAMRVLAYLGLGCFAAMVAIFWDKLVGTNASPLGANHSINTILEDAEKFSEEYGDVYVLTDKLKKQRREKHRNQLLHKHHG